MKNFKKIALAGLLSVSGVGLANSEDYSNSKEYSFTLEDASMMNTLFLFCNENQNESNLCRELRRFFANKYLLDKDGQEFIKLLQKFNDEVEDKLVEKKSEKVEESQADNSTLGNFIEANDSSSYEEDEEFDNDSSDDSSLKELVESSGSGSNREESSSESDSSDDETSDDFEA